MDVGELLGVRSDGIPDGSVAQGIRRDLGRRDAMIGPKPQQFLLDAETCRSPGNGCGGIAKIFRSWQRDVVAWRTLHPALRPAGAGEKRDDLRELCKIAGSRASRGLAGP